MGLKGAGGTPRGKCGTGGTIGMRLKGRIRAKDREFSSTDPVDDCEPVGGFIVSDGR